MTDKIEYTYPVGTSVTFLINDDVRRVENGDTGLVVESFAPQQGRNVKLWDGRVVNVSVNDIEELSCLDAPRNFGEECEGQVEYRFALSGTGQSFPRCAKHWRERLDIQDGINARYPEHAPADFDPYYAGESWDED
jgi:hypothetical protein